jgi:hypothetical protein
MTQWTPTARRRAASGDADDVLRDAARTPLGGPEGNARLTGATAAVLLVLLAAEGLTVLQVRSLLTPHVVIGMVLVPFVVVKLCSTGWRMARYYLGDPAYRRRGAPPILLRLLGPVVVLLTVLLFASGIALLLVPHSLRAGTMFVHKASFVLWFGAMTIHVLGHVLETSRLAPADLASATRSQVRGAGARLWVQAACLVVGAVLAVVMAPTVGPWLAGGGVGG